MDFIKHIKDLGWIKKGDTVYVISDALSLAKDYRENGQRLDLNQIIDGLKELVGKDGTLLFPTFNWDFCKGIAFDYAKTPCKTGALSKAALKREDFLRTTHPLYSFAVWGANAVSLASIENKNAFGEGTIFEELEKLKAKALVIGIPALSGFTYIHHVEQMVGVSFRYNKDFTADYIDRDGNCTSRTYSMYVRDLDMNPIHINGFEPLERIMLDEGYIKRDRFCSTMISLMNIKDTFEPIRKDLCENGAKNMYTFSIEPQ